MKYRTLGNSPLRVSEICLGTMTWGQQNTEEEARRQIDEALDAGINFIDTAEMYPVPPRAATYGETEAILGRWLTSRKRQNLVIATKIIGPSTRLSWIRNGENDFTSAHISSALEGSLKRLKTDYVDLYQLHWPSRKTNYFGKLGYSHKESGDGVSFDRSLLSLEKLLKQGKILHYGLSNETPWGLMACARSAKAMGLPPPVSVQNPYSLLNRTFEIGCTEICHREKIGLLAYSPLGFGILTGKYLKGKKPAGSRLGLFGTQLNRYSNNQSMSAASRYYKVAEKYKVSPAQMAIAYILSKPFVASVIIGATTLKQLRENIRSRQLELPQSLVEDVEKIHADTPNPAP